MFIYLPNTHLPDALSTAQYGNPRNAATRLTAANGDFTSKSPNVLVFSHNQNLSNIMR
jgi:hypothetical protein